ncbi:MAG: hypothetical protein ABJG78_20455 [Cyclobacteriaceae bacterium]
MKIFQHLILASSITFSAFAQDLSIAHFEDDENWPLYVPGDLKFDNERLTDLRVEYQANEMGGPGGPGFRLYMDVMDVVFKGRPADWIQWTFSEREDEENTGAPNLDLLIMDRETYKLLFRLMPNGGPGPDKWAGPYGNVQAMPGKIRQLKVKNDGSASMDSLAVNTPVFEFASLGFQFPFMDLEEGKSFRLKGYHFPTNTVGNMSVKVIGKTLIRDVKGNTYEAWQVDVLPASRKSMVTYYVSKEAPYFYGWNYRLVENSKVLFKMDYVGWQSTKIKG